MKVSEIPEFQSRFLSGDEIGDKIVTLEITEVKKEQVPENPMRPTGPQVDAYVVYFKAHKRGVKLNKTRAKEMRAILGDEMDNWKAKTVMVFAKEQKVKGEFMPVLHFRNAGTVSQLPEEEIDINSIPFGK